MKSAEVNLEIDQVGYFFHDLSNFLKRLSEYFQKEGYKVLLSDNSPTVVLLDKEFIKYVKVPVTKKVYLNRSDYEERALELKQREIGVQSALERAYQKAKPKVVEKVVEKVVHRIPNYVTKQAGDRLDAYNVMKRFDKLEERLNENY